MSLTIESNGLIRVSQFGGGNSQNFANTYYFSSTNEAWNNQAASFGMASNGNTSYSLTRSFTLSSSGGKFYLDSGSFLATGVTNSYTSFDYALYNGHKVQVYKKGAQVNIFTITYTVSSSATYKNGTLSGVLPHKSWNVIRLKKA